jgi:hypothetical protein
MEIKDLKKEISGLQIKKNLTPRAEPVFGVKVSKLLILLSRITLTSTLEMW